MKYLICGNSDCDNKGTYLSLFNSVDKLYLVLCDKHKKYYSTSKNINFYELGKQIK